MASEEKRKKYRVEFNNNWTEEYPMKAVPGDIYKFYCIPCSKKLSCDHQGVKDVIDHCKKESHKNCVEASKKQSSMMSFLKNETTPLDKQVVNAEVMITNFLIQHDLPLAASDHLSFRGVVEGRLRGLSLPY